MRAACEMGRNFHIWAWVTYMFVASHVKFRKTLQAMSQWKMPLQHMPIYQQCYRRNCHPTTYRSINDTVVEIATATHTDPPIVVQ